MARPSNAPVVQSRVTGLLLWLGMAGVWFASAQILPWFEPDEGRYAEIPREMLASGDWVVPRLDGLKYCEKPPLQYWVTAALYRSFGLSEWTSRLWSLGLAFLCLPLTFAWVARVCGRPAGLAALTVLATSPFFLVVGHLNLLDAGLTFWLSCALFAFALAQMTLRASRAERNWMLAAWLAAALAVLSKGIVVAVLAGLSLVIYSVSRRDWQPWRRLHIRLGVPLFLLVAAPWFVIISMREADFARFFFLHEHFARFLTTVHHRTEPVWFFLPLALFAFLPWLGDLPGAARAAWRGRPEQRFDPLRFLLIYSLVVLIFFSISQSKLPTYILPMVPPLAAVLGVHIASRPGSTRRALRLASASITAFTVMLAGYSLYRYGVLPQSLVVWMVVAAGIVMICGFSVRAHRPEVRIVSILAESVLAWQCLLLGYAALPTDRSAHDLVAGLRRLIHPGTDLYSVYQYRQTIPPYLGRTLTVVAYKGDLEFGLSQEPGRNSATLEEFKRRWRHSDDAIAFVEPDKLAVLQREGLPGRIIASDSVSLVLSRR